MLCKTFEGKQIKNVNLSGNNNMDPDQMKAFLDAVHPLKLNISDHEFSKAGSNMMRALNVGELNMDYAMFAKDFSTDDLVYTLNGGLTKLSMVNSSITTDQLKNIATYLKTGISLQSLNLTHVELSEEGIEAVAEIANKPVNGLNQLNLSGCGLTSGKLAAFGNKIEKKVEFLIISNNPIKDCDTLSKIAGIVHKASTKQLDMSCCGLTEEVIQKFFSSDTETINVETIDLSENPGIDPKGTGNMVAKWEVKNLDLSECLWTANDLSEFSQSLGQHKLKSVDLSEPMELPTEDKKKLVAEITWAENVVYRSRLPDDKKLFI
uniref:uncharacterized protein LOC120341441 n=1 Tax=Styela clava TaxID=7725 RepID=UPI00193A1E85|nr:uncharacterized protein LOC120341441 [Styela clava]